MQIVKWEDHKAPDEAVFGSLQFLLRRALDYHKTGKAPPIVVHCSAGIGRTGTFVALYNILQALEIFNQIKGTV